MRALYDAILALALVAPQPPIPQAADDAKVPDVPAVVKVQPGQFAVIRIGKDTEAIYGFDQAKCPLIRLASEEGQLFYLVNPLEPGSYPVMFRFKASSRGVLCTIDASNPTPPPPPKPDVDEALRRRLRDAYGRDGGTSAQNEDARKLLAELYRQAAELVLSAPTPDALLDQLRRASASLADDRLTETRTIVAEEVGRVLTLGMVFTDTNRRQAAELFARLAVALDW